MEQIIDNTNDDSLKDRLHRSKKECYRKHQSFFIPQNCIDEYITEQVVVKDIRAANSDITEEAALNYARQTCKSAKRLYAILACLKKCGDISNLIEEDVSDKDLPFVRKPVGNKEFTQQRKDGTSIKTLDKWNDKHLEKFDRKQFWMTAPVFELEKHYELDIKDNLPFLCLKPDEEANKPKYQGGYSEVYPVRIHPSHHKFWKHSGPEDEEPLVAVKQLFSSDREEFRKEETILKALRIKGHPHLIKLLATYKQDEKYHLLFPYADSNLREYWERFPSPTFDKPTVLWSLKQMTGIANGLNLIHIYRVSIPLSVSGEVRVLGKGAKLSVLRGEEQYGRHGDIKPENVLWFKNHPEIQDDMGVLQVADFGLGRFHGRDSRSRVNPATIATSPTYEPPECKLGKDVSRKYDVWSLGCIYLEFITWLLKGSNQIEDFANRRGVFNPYTGIDEDNFFTLVQDPDHGPIFATVREQVVAWVDELHSHEKCSQLIHNLLDLTMRELLKPDPQDRGQAAWIFQQMKMFLDTASKDEDYLLKPVPYQQKRSSLRRTKSTENLGKEEEIYQQALQGKKKALVLEGMLKPDYMDKFGSTSRNTGEEAEARELQIEASSVPEENPSELQTSDQRQKQEPLSISSLDVKDDSEAESEMSDVPSIFSTTESLALSDSTSGFMHAYRINVADQLATELLKEDELKSLCEEALTKLGKLKFAKYHDVLLKELLIALRLGATGHQLQAVRMLRGSYPRARITTRIIELLEPTNMLREQAMQEFQKFEADRKYSLNQLLKPPVPKPTPNANIPDENSERPDKFKEEEKSDEESNGDNDEDEDDEDEQNEEEDEEDEEEPSEPIDAVVAYLIKGAPFAQFKARLRNIIHPPATLQEALKTRHIRTIQKLLEKQFQFVATENYTWLYELHEAGYSCHEMAELLLEEADYAPWIPFDPSRLEHADIEYGTHLARCIHHTNANDSEISLYNLNMSTTDLLRKNEEAKRAVQELCGLAGISPMSWDSKDWNGYVKFDQENTLANVCYTCHDHEESDFSVIVSRITKALQGFYEAFGHIQQAGLCCDSFTILLNLTPISLTSTSSPDLELPTTPRVELWRVDLRPPLQLREELKHLSTLKTITQAETPTCRNIARTILEPLLRNTSHQSVDSGENIDYTLHLCALAVQFLCLGLLSYSQAHVGAIHPFFLDTPQRCVLLSGATKKHIKIAARLNHLTCFGEMLKGRPVLTFSAIIHEISGLHLSQGTSKYDLLASPEDILDTWGPGQFVYQKDHQGQPCAISIGGGVIYAIDNTAKNFHWKLRDPTNCMEWQMGLHNQENRETEFGTALYTVAFNPRLKIIIGALVTVNETCSLDEKQCWNNCYHFLQPLGTSRPYWKPVERQGGIQAGGQYVVAQLNQTWAKDDGKTLKQVFLDHDDAHLISFLECRWGVQVSFCTGVAKRVLLRQLVADVIPLFARRAIAIALVKENLWEDLVKTDIVGKFQNQKLADWYPSLAPDHRKVVSELTCCIVRTLRETGIDRDGNLVMAWPREHDVYQCFKVPCKEQSYWARILADSKDSATFAYVSTKCLVSSQVHCSGSTSMWRNASTMLGTAVLPPMSVPRPTEWVLHHGEKYFIKTRDSLVHLSVYMNSGNGGSSTCACLIPKRMNVPEHIKNRLLNRKWQKEEGRLRERRDDLQHSIDVLVLNPGGFLAT